jgi:acetyl-CoA carboxylase beta subunit
MKISACIKALVALMFTTSSPILAQWVQTNGPYGGVVSSFAVLGKNIFAGTDGGVWKRKF